MPHSFGKMHVLSSAFSSPTFIESVPGSEQVMTARTTFTAANTYKYSKTDIAASSAQMPLQDPLF
jgi:hypothetical protein